MNTKPHLSLPALAALFLGASATRADSVKIVWVNKVPTARYTPDLKDKKLEKNECYCLVVMIGAKDGLILDEVKIARTTDETVGWNAKARFAPYFSNVKEVRGLFEGYQFIVYDDEKRLVAHDRAIDLPLAAPSGAKIDWEKFGKQAKVYATLGTFTATPAKVTNNPKDAPEVRHASRRALWRFSPPTIYTPSESAVFDTTPPAQADNAASDKDEELAGQLLTKAKFLSATGQKDQAKEKFQEILKKYPNTKAADDASKGLDKLKK